MTCFNDQENHREETCKPLSSSVWSPHAEYHANPHWLAQCGLAWWYSALTPYNPFLIVEGDPSLVVGR
ncbi:jg12419 [Pararge aegeria aegeria]|uniref:Jg12419 protein n=1 Tax=Pararge aegeria aegeria TaxID=348720 RepID=A0A8S4R7Z2_9NEOP|nr:jg12419 [Pararge aegeria aegeria]